MVNKIHLFDNTVLQAYHRCTPDGQWTYYVHYQYCPGGQRTVYVHLNSTGLFFNPKLYLF